MSVNDAFLLFQNTNQIEKFKYYLNLQHSNMKSTSETNSSLLFLEIKVIREINKFTTSVYPKPICSGVFLLTSRNSYLILTNTS